MKRNLVNPETETENGIFLKTENNPPITRRK